MLHSVLKNIDVYYHHIRSTQYVYKYLHMFYIYQLECGPMPNLMVALPNIGGALCSTPQSLADAHY